MLVGNFTSAATESRILLANIRKRQTVFFHYTVLRKTLENIHCGVFLQIWHRPRSGKCEEAAV